MGGLHIPSVMKIVSCNFPPSPPQVAAASVQSENRKMTCTASGRGMCLFQGDRA